jgi:hypothetical protein
MCFYTHGVCESVSLLMCECGHRAWSQPHCLLATAAGQFGAMVLKLNWPWCAEWSCNCIWGVQQFPMQWLQQMPSQWTQSGVACNENSDVLRACAGPDAWHVSTVVCCLYHPAMAPV